MCWYKLHQLTSISGPQPHVLHEYLNAASTFWERGQGHHDSTETCNAYRWIRRNYIWVVYVCYVHPSLLFWPIMAVMSFGWGNTHRFNKHCVCMSLVSMPIILNNRLQLHSFGMPTHSHSQIFYRTHTHTRTSQIVIFSLIHPLPNHSFSQWILNDAMEITLESVSFGVFQVVNTLERKSRYFDMHIVRLLRPTTFASKQQLSDDYM